MKKITKIILSGILSLSLWTSIIPTNLKAAQESVAIDETSFPDASLRYYVMDNIDTNHDSLLSQEERDNITKLDFNAINLDDTTGLGYFQNLSELDLRNNTIENLDLSQNPALKTLTIGDNGNQIYDFDNHPGIENLIIFNHKQPVDISSLPNLKSLSTDYYGFALDLTSNIHLKTLNIEDNYEYELDLSNCSELTSLAISGNTKSVTINENCNLTSLEIRNGAYKAIDLSKITGLTEFTYSPTYEGDDFDFQAFINQNPRIKKLDLSVDGDIDFSKLTELEELHLDNYTAKRESLDLTSVPTLKRLVLPVGAFYDSVAVDLSNNEEIEEIIGNITSLKLGDNYLKLKKINIDRLENPIDLSGCTNLTQLSLGTYNFDLDLTNNPHLEKLLLDGFGGNLTINEDNNIVEVKIPKDYEKFKKAKKIDFSLTRLMNYDFSQNPELEEMISNGSNLRQVDFSNNNKLKRIEMRRSGDHTLIETIVLNKSNTLESVNLKGNLNLKQVDFKNQKSLKDVDISESPGMHNNDFSGCSSLKEVNFTNNWEIESVNFTGCNSLETIKMGETSIKEIDLRDCPNLKSIKTSTVLRKLDINHCNKIEELHLNSQMVNNIDIANLPRLKKLTCNEANLTSYDFSSNKLLENVSVAGYAGNLDFTKCKKLKYLILSGVRSPLLDLSGTKNLEELDIINSTVGRIEFNDTPVLKSIMPNGSRIVDWDLTIDKLNTMNTGLNCIYYWGWGIDKPTVMTLNYDKEWPSSDEFAGREDIYGGGLQSPEENADFSFVVDRNSFDMLEISPSFDPSRVFNVTGATLEGTTFSNYNNTTPIKYDYYDGDNIYIVSVTTIHVTLNVSYASDDDSIIINKDLNRIYDGKVTSLSMSDCTFNGVKIKALYKWQQKIDGEWIDCSNPCNVGEYRAKVVGVDDLLNECGESAWKEFKISKAEPTYEVPSGLTAFYGQQLSEISLPEHFIWDDPDHVIVENEEHVYKVIYTPNDSDNYNTIDNIDVTIEVHAVTGALENKIKEAKNIDIRYKTDASKQVLLNAIAKGEAIVAKANPTLAEISQAIQDIDSAIAGLENKPVIKPDKTDLRNVLRKSKIYVLDHLSEASRTELTAAIENGIKIEAKEDATFNEVDPATMAVIRAMNHIKSNMTFGDVRSDQWFYLVVDGAYARGLMGAEVVDKNLFKPDNPITRGMVATVLYRMSGTPEVTNKNPFVDVKEGIWYTNAIVWLNQMGVVSGKDATHFEPDANITRQELATMLRNYAYKVAKKDVNLDASLDDFSDKNDIDLWAESAVKWCVGNKIIAGTVQKDGSKKINPKNNASRAESAKMFTLLQNIVIE